MAQSGDRVGEKLIIMRAVEAWGFLLLLDLNCEINF